MQDHGIALHGDRILSCRYDLGEAKQLGIALLKTGRPTAIICGNDVIALGVVYAASRLGLSIPHDVSIAGIGDFRGSEHLEPGLTTVRLPAKRIGKTAAETLLHMSETGLFPNPLNYALPLELKIRGSTGKFQV